VAEEWDRLADQQEHATDLRDRKTNGRWFWSAWIAFGHGYREALGRLLRVSTVG